MIMMMAIILIIIIIIITTIIIIIIKYWKYWVDVQQGIVSSHGERNPL